MTANKNNEWLFILGREHPLSAAEISAVFSSRGIDYKITNFTDENLVIDTEQTIVAPELMSRLGGTIKIGKRLDITVNGIAYFLHYFLPHGKINFALNGFDKKDWIKIKEELKSLGRSARYVEIKNTASTLFNNLIRKGAELTLFDQKIFITQAIQPFLNFGDRDYGRPGRDDRSGMLPPKLAMMMINLAQTPANSTILDPFCGSGTIITEAVLLEYKKIIGADVSEKAVADTKKNVEWIMVRYSLPPTHYSLNIFQSDARNLSEKIKNGSVDTIITEPFLGKPLNGRETFAEIKTQINELKKLYVFAFEQFNKILKKNSSVIFIIPRFRFKGDWMKMDCLAEIKKLGFEPAPLWENQNFLLYSRPDQHVGREIWKFILSSP